MDIRPGRRSCALNETGRRPRHMDVPIPTYRDLMLPTLVALQKLGGSASIAELEELVPEIAEISKVQMAVVYPETAAMPGRSKIISRMQSRVYLKKMGALTNSVRGVWAITPKGQEYLGMERSVTIEALIQADNEIRAETRMARKRKAES